MLDAMCGTHAGMYGAVHVLHATLHPDQTPRTQRPGA